MAVSMLVCATCARAPRGRAQTAGAGEQGVAAPSEEESVASRLIALRSALEHARFQEARSDALSLLDRPNLRASERNDLLELLAIAQIAARDEAGARKTLRDLFARDPEHGEWLRDPGPTVSAAFARARSEAAEPIAPELTTRLLREPSGRLLAEVQLGEGRDAVESVHVFVRAAHGVESSHLVQEVGSDARLAILLPPLGAARGESELSLYVEARAPSGTVLARSGTPLMPLRFPLPPSPDACADPRPPLRRAWWLWTSVAIVVAGLGVSGAIAAH